MSDLLSSFLGLKPEKEKRTKRTIGLNLLVRLGLAKDPDKEMKHRQLENLKIKILSKDINLRRLSLLRKSNIIDKKLFLSTKSLLIASRNFGLGVRMNKMISSIFLRLKLNSPALVKIARLFFIKLSIAIKDIHSLDVPSGKGLKLSRGDKLLLDMIRVAKFVIFLFLEKMRNTPLEINKKEKIDLIEKAKKELELYERNILQRRNNHFYGFGLDLDDLCLSKFKENNDKKKEKRKKNTPWQ